MKTKPKSKPKRRNPIAIPALMRRAGPMKDRRKKRRDRKTWKKEIEEDKCCGAFE